MKSFLPTRPISYKRTYSDKLLAAASNYALVVDVEINLYKYLS